jgi:hypothetical protein
MGQGGKPGKQEWENDYSGTRGAVYFIDVDVNGGGFTRGYIIP